MVNPLELLAHRERARERESASLARVKVQVPTDVPNDDAIFLVLRRMRLPLILVVAIFSFCTLGLSLMPGTDDAGHPHHLTIFDAFYVMSYTATTIGFGEIPYAFSYAQRMWVTLSIYLTVTGWAYAISSLFGLLQDRGFRAAIATQRFRSRVARIKEPYWIVAGYGDTGRAVCARLDQLGRRVVVLDDNRQRIERLDSDQLTCEVPALDGDVGNPALLGLAGLDRPQCEGVIALTSDEANLAVVMAVNLLRPDVRVIARCDDGTVAERMANFDPTAVINPYDRYGAYLSHSLRHPEAYELAQWLLGPDGEPFVERPRGLTRGTWIVVGNDRFGDEVAGDLRAVDIDVARFDPRQGDPDVSAATGLVAGTSNDVRNLALAAHARLAKPDIFLAVRQRSDRQAASMRAFDADSLFVPSDLVARETLARIMDPAYWGFIQHVLHTHDDAWSQRVLRAVRDRVGDASPTAQGLHLDAARSPAVVRWLSAGHRLTIRDLLRDPDDRDEPLRIFCLSLLRGDDADHVPDEDTELRVGDELVLTGTPDSLRDLREVREDVGTLEYLVTGDDVPRTWLFRRLARRRRGRRTR